MSSLSEEQPPKAGPASHSRLKSRPNPDDVIKILISTDTHLGYMEKDPVRGDDSFRAFEEVLEIARVNQVDMVLLGGDFFHDNKPSRSTLVKAMRILRNLCMSPEGEIKLAVRSDPGSINYMNPCVAVSLPVFAIHGNHDDPTGGTGLDALSSLDLLAETGLITYFGKTATSKKIEVAPILLQKGRTGLALYGLGNVRDEILYDTWAKQRNVKWLSPEEPGDVDDSQEQGQEDQNSLNVPKWFNLFVLHQNRYMRGSAKGISDTMLPPWLDYVVWGHEHDSIPDLTETKPPIVQPGSTVATSLSKGESKQKHAVMLEIFQGKAKHRKIPLRTVRHFHFDDVILSEQEGLSETDPDALKAFLGKTVDDMVKGQESAFDKMLSDIQSGTSAEQIKGVKYPARSWYRRKLTRLIRQPLIRLRVESTGNWEIPNPNRFGQDFVGRVACPADILLFYRNKRQPLRRTRTYIQGYGGEMGIHGGGHDDAIDVENDLSMSQLDSEEQNALQIPEFVHYYLCHPKAGGSGLKFLELDKLTQAVDQFVNKSEKDAIIDYINSFLKEQQKKTLHEAADKDKEWDEDELLEKFKSGAALAEKRLQTKANLNRTTEKDQMDVTTPDTKENQEINQAANKEDKEVLSKLDTIHAVVTSNPKIVAATTNTRANKERFEEMEQEDNDEIEPATTATRAKSTRGRGRNRGRGSASSRKPPASTRQNANPRRSGRKVQSRLSQLIVEDSDDEIAPVVESEEEGDDYVPVTSSARKRRAKKPSSIAPSSSRARTDSMSGTASRRGTPGRARPKRNTATIDVDEESGDDAM